jgi:sulfur-carrier protein
LAIVLLPATLAAEAGGSKRFELEAGTVGEALRQLPIAGLLFDETGELRRLINVYVNGVDARGGRLLDEPLTDDSEVRIVGAVAGGEGDIQGNARLWL